jgi:hypothetical protein
MTDPENALVPRHASRTVDAGRSVELKVDHLFAGFRQNTGNLVLLRVLAAIPVGLGFVLLLPVAAGSVHAAYMDIFEAY